MIRREYAAAGVIGGPVPMGLPRRRGLARRALRLVAEIVKLGVVLPLGLALAAVVWLASQFLKL